LIASLKYVSYGRHSGVKILVKKSIN